MQRWIPVLAAVLLAGCTHISPDAAMRPDTTPCQEVEVPSLRIGDAFHYRFQGLPYTPATGHLLTDWRIASDNAPTHSGTYRYPEGSSWVLQVGSPTEVPRPDGTPTRAVPIESWLDSPDYPGSIHALDEFLDFETGNLVAVHNRAMLTHDGSEARHQVRFDRDSRPPAIGAAVLSNQTITPNWTTEFPVEPESFDGVTVDGEPGWFRAWAESLFMVDGACTAQIAWSYHAPAFEGDLHSDVFGDEIRGTFHAMDGIPLPRRIAFEPWTGSSQQPPPHFTLQQWSRGTGEEVRAFSPGQSAFQPTPAHPTQDGVPADPDCSFGTCLADAVDRMRTHPTAADWFRDNPDAAPWFLEHREGTSDGPFRDQWWIIWQGDEGALSTMYRQPRDPLVTANMFTINEVRDRGGTIAWNQSIDLEAMADIHRSYHGSEPEMLTCFFTQWACGVITHDEGGGSRVGEFGGGQELMGLTFDARDGRLYQLDATAPVIQTSGPEGVTRPSYDIG